MDKFLKDLGFEEVSKEYAEQYGCEDDAVTLADVIEDALSRDQMRAEGIIIPFDDEDYVLESEKDRLERAGKQI